jgi:hypothetical protein
VMMITISFMLYVIFFRNYDQEPAVLAAKDINSAERLVPAVSQTLMLLAFWMT